MCPHHTRTNTTIYYLPVPLHKRKNWTYYSYVPSTEKKKKNSLYSFALDLHSSMFISVYRTSRVVPHGLRWERLVPRVVRMAKQARPLRLRLPTTSLYADSSIIFRTALRCCRQALRRLQRACALPYGGRRRAVLPPYLYGRHTRTRDSVSTRVLFCNALYRLLLLVRLSSLSVCLQKKKKNTSYHNISTSTPIQHSAITLTSPLCPAMYYSYSVD